MLNKVFLIGNVGKDPETGVAANGSAWARFTLATSKRWKDKDSGEQKEQTEWHNISCFGDGLVKVMREHVKKGQQLHVEGEIRTRKWADDKGVDRWTTEIVVQGFDGRVTLLGRREQTGRPSDAPPATEAPPSRSNGTERNYGDEIPF